MSETGRLTRRLGLTAIAAGLTALAGIDPGLGEIGAAKLPKGAVVGTNSAGKVGYSLCPPGPGETYMLALYALPRSLSTRTGESPPTSTIPPPYT